MGSVFLRALATLIFLLHFGAAIAVPTGTPVATAIERLQNLKKENQKNLAENKLRQEFLDRLIFQIDTRYKNGSMYSFLRDTLKRMARQHPASPMYDFLMQASDLMHHREPGDDAISLLQRYLRAGGILNPVPVREFLARESYINSERSEYVTGQNIEEIDLSTRATSSSADRPILRNVEIRE